MAKKVKREKEEVKFMATKNSELTCKDCMLNNTGNDLAVLTCDAYTTKPMKVLMGGECDEKITNS